MTGNKIRGFTLIEVLIATAVTAFVFLLGSSVFVGHFQTQSRTQEQLKLEGALRQIESVVRGVVMEATAITMSDNTLRLVNREGRVVRFIFDGVEGDRRFLICRGQECDTADPQTTPNLFSSLNPKETSVSRGLFLVNNSSSAHPLITLVLQLTDDQSGKTSPIAQFSVTSRAYVP